MKSELQFFMTKQDEYELLNYFLKHFDNVERGQIFDKLWVKDGFIQLLHSRKYGNTLTAGRIAVMTTLDKNFPIEKIYNSMRRWIKKYYKNNMSVENEKIHESKIDIKNFWYSKNIFEWLHENKKRNLRQFKDGTAIFIPK